VSQEVELPGIGSGLWTLGVGATLVVAALLPARRLLGRRPGVFVRWGALEVLALCLTPLLALRVLQSWLPGEDALWQLLQNELALAGTAALIGVLARRRPGGLGGLGLVRPPGPRALLGGLLLFVPLFVALLGLGVLWLHVAAARGWATEQAVMQAILSLQGGRFQAALVLAIVVGPWLEEFLFRGFLQGALAGPLGEGRALLASSFLFALLHGRAALPMLFVLSLFLGWLQLRTRSLWVPWALHALNNALVLTLALGAPPG